MHRYLRRFDEIGASDIAMVGGKAANLGELRTACLPVPPGFVLTTEAYELFVATWGIQQRIARLATSAGTDPADYEQACAHIRELFVERDVPQQVRTELWRAYRDMGEPPVAVRSSATAEDLEGASFAGQQDTYLNIQGEDELVTAVRNCWASLWTARAMSYRARQGIAPEQVSLAVVVQRMVQSEPDIAAGVMFTANPANGRRDQTVISAAWGLGESVVSGTVSTDDLVVESGRVLSRSIADKRVMTVTTDGGTEERAVDPRRRGEPVLDDASAVALATLGARITEHYRAPQDIEWARSGGSFFILQSRPITALPEPTGDIPTTWPRPDRTSIYFRASIVEQMPDPLSPLFADMIGPSVTRSLTALMTQTFGAALHDGDIAFPTINGYAYYAYRRGSFGRMLLATPVAMVKLLASRSSRGVAMGCEGWREHAHPVYAETVRAWSARPVAELSDRELLDGVGALLDAGTTYYTAVQSVIPQAALSEMFFRVFYDRAVRRAGDPPAVEFLLGFDSQPIRAEKSLYDLAAWVRARPALADHVAATPSTELFRADAPGVDPQQWREWRDRFEQHRERYGHVAYNLDFMVPVAADDPAALLDTLRFHLSGQGGDPHERQRRSAERRRSHTRALRSRLGPLRAAVLIRLLRRAQRTGPVREDALADISLAWPLIRRMLLELGARLAASGVLASAQDVFWLRHRELAERRRLPVEVIEQRKMTWRGQRAASPPQMLPELSWATRALRGAMPAGDQSQTGSTITGVGASAGQVSAPARVLGGPEDFGQLRPGEVLVARMTTPAWTSLFAMASAVVTDVGGPLSHSSIVAREYGIPAVLGTGVATQRLHSGQRIHVDGTAGTVTSAD